MLKLPQLSKWPAAAASLKSARLIGMIIGSSSELSSGRSRMTAVTR
jgi:hypothetical protein